jgi:hypothetical protein
MVRKNSANTSSAAPKKSTGNALAFGGTVKSIVLPSGSKLLFNEPDQDGIIVFLGTKDVSDKVGKEPGEVVYIIGHDGRRPVSLPMSYKIKEDIDKFVPNRFYYLHLADCVQTNPSFNPMKDFSIVEMGVEGDVVPVTSERLPGIAEITLSLPRIEELNYKLLNYPLRKV